MVAAGQLAARAATGLAAPARPRRPSLPRSGRRRGHDHSCVVLTQRSFRPSFQTALSFLRRARRTLKKRVRPPSARSRSGAIRLLAHGGHTRRSVQVAARLLRNASPAPLVRRAEPRPVVTRFPSARRLLISSVLFFTLFAVVAVRVEPPSPVLRRARRPPAPRRCSARTRRPSSRSS